MRNQGSIKGQRPGPVADTEVSVLPSFIRLPVVFVLTASWDFSSPTKDGTHTHCTGPPGKFTTLPFLTPFTSMHTSFHLEVKNVVTGSWSSTKETHTLSCWFYIARWLPW